MDTEFLYTPAETAQLIADNAALLIDIRDRAAYDFGHIPGAVHVPEVFTYLSFSTPEGLGELHGIFLDLFSKAGVEADKKIIFYEENMDSRYGASCRGYWLLTYLGHEHAGILDGGMLAWSWAGLVSEIKEVQPVPGHFMVQPRPELIADRGEVLAALDSPDIILLDNRDADEWRGVSSSPYGKDFAPRKGHIPGARWIEWYEFMERGQEVAAFKDNGEIRALCASQGMYPDSDVIIYCFKGSRAAHTYVALKLAGFKRLRIYFASWNEWSRDLALPVAG